MMTESTAIAKNENETCLLTFDLEEFVVPKEQGLSYVEEDLFNISIEGLQTILRIIKKQGVRATFFTTKTFAQNKKVQKLLKELIKDGNEIALHGNDHMDRYAVMNEQEIVHNISEAKEYLETTLKINIKGFRAPHLQKVSPKILKNLGLTYDASLHPTWVPGYYCDVFKSRKIKMIDGVASIPISVTPLVRLTFSWFWFRNFGLGYAKCCTRCNFMNSNYVQLYFHPWDFYDFQKNEHPWKINRFLVRNTGKLPDWIMNYLGWLKGQGVSYSTIGEYLK